MKTAAKKKRLINFIIDTFWFAFFYSLYRNGYLNEGDYLFFLALYFIQYWLLESIWGKTLGKVITKTRVVKRDGEKAGFGRIFFRTFLRFIPFDGLTFLFLKEGGFHDWLSKTRVVDNDERYKIKENEWEKDKNGIGQQVLEKASFDNDEINKKEVGSPTFKNLTCRVLAVFFCLAVISVLLFLFYPSRLSQTVVKAPTVSFTPTAIPSPDVLLDIPETVELNKGYLVQVICIEDDFDIMGSGVIIGKKEGNILILTNYHIVENFKRNFSGIPNCAINHWESGEYYYVEPIILDSFQKEDMEIIDFAVLKILPELKIDYFILNEDGTKTKSTKPTSLLSLNSFPTICNSNEINIGDEIVVLGFPTIGGTYIPGFGQVTDFTVTEGIVSSKISDDKWYIKTSAKIDAGNSGGGAFSTKHGCLVGIPTYSTVGEMESMGSMINVRKLLIDYLPSIRGSVFLNLINEGNKSFPNSE